MNASTVVTSSESSTSQCPDSSPSDLNMQGPLTGVPLSEVKPPVAKEQLRVLLADDHPVIRLGTGAFLKLELGCEICAETGDGREALKLAESTRPDVAVIDRAPAHPAPSTMPIAANSSSAWTTA